MTTLNVAQPDGEITLGDRRGEVVYPVTNGTVEVDEAEVDSFLSHVIGSSLQEGPASTETTPPAEPAGKWSSSKPEK